MARLTLQADGDWVRLVGPVNRNFVEFLKYGVKPLSHRRYDAPSRAWLVYWSQLRNIVGAARRFYDAVDWSTLPPEWQMHIAGAQVEASAPSIEDNPYATLFLVDDAPLEVVKAAYRALAQLHHPDHVGGTTDAFQRIDSAYRKIMQQRQH